MRKDSPNENVIGIQPHVSIDGLAQLPAWQHEEVTKKELLFYYGKNEGVYASCRL